MSANFGHLIVQSIFFLKHRQTDRQTGRQSQTQLSPTYTLATACMGKQQRADR